ncbi:MAG TPA: S-layer homology domain-containing protein, partial [Candidatus Agathobaculum merdipullorum]|nr:S-layer homology domain-containing protein [Candidatus Agathobaculum merdipullorum]
LPTSFTDVNGTWAAGYIKYLQNSEIIAGKSATKFAPNDTVTGLEAAKMLLVVAGYTPDKAGLTGSRWSANTMKYANLNNLFEDVSADVNGALPRQYAAQIMYNALDMERVVYSADIADFKPATAGDILDDATIGGKYMDLDFNGKKVDDAVYLYGTEKEANRDTYSMDTSDGTYIRVANDYSDLVGQRVVVMQKIGQRDKVYGVYAYADSTTVATGYVGQLETVSDNTKIKLDGTEYKLDGTTAMKNYTFNNDTTKRFALSALAATATKNNDAKQNEVAQEIKLIDTDGDGKVEVVISSPIKFGKVTYVGTNSMTVDNNVGSLKFTDISGYEDIAKDDYVYVIDDAYNSSDKDIVVKADVTSATVDATRTSGGLVVEARVDGTWYRTAKNVVIKSGATYDLVIRGNYILAADETTGKLEDVAYLSAIADTVGDGTGDADVDTKFDDPNGEGTVKARMYFPDGTDAEVKISKYDGEKLLGGRNLGAGSSNNKIGANTALKPSGTFLIGLVTYSKLADGSYDIKQVQDEKDAGCDAYFNGALTYKDGKINGNPFNDDAVVYVKAGTETKVISGKTAKGWDNSAVHVTGGFALANEKDGLNYIAVAFLTIREATVPGATSDTKYAYLTRDGYTVTKDGEKKAAYDVWTSEGAATLTQDQSNPIVGATAGTVISYTLDGDYVDDVTVVGADAAIIGTDRVVKGSARVAHAGGVATYSFDEDCVFVAIDDSETAGAEGDITGIPLAENCGGSNYIANAIVVFDNNVVPADRKIVAVFYDVDNMLDGSVGGVTHGTYTDKHFHFAG